MPEKKRTSRGATDGAPGDDGAWGLGGRLTAPVVPKKVMSAATPDKVAHFTIEEELGRGGMGVVYRARDQNLDRPVALKVLPPELANDPERRERFLREARAAAKAQHENIAVIYDAGEDGDLVYIAMELIDGESLRARLARGAVDPEEALDICGAILSGLVAAHEAKVVHRDLKPDNVMLTSAGKVKVLDFGLAKVLGPGTDQAHVDESVETQTGALTREGVTMGTLGYMSPEQAAGDGVDHRTDIFALGVIAYELLTGKAPFVGKTPLEVIIATSRDEPEPVSSRRHGLAPAIDAWVARCLAKKPDDRHADAAHALQALEEARAPATQVDAPPELPPPPKRTIEEIAQEQPATTFRSPRIGGQKTKRIVGLVVLVMACAGVFVASRFWLGREPSLCPTVSETQDVQDEFCRGIEAYLRTDITSAETSFLTVVEKAPDHPWPRLGLALVYGLKQHYEGSSEAMVQAAERLDGVEARDAELIRMVRDFGGGDNEEVVERWNTYRAEHPDYFMAHQVMAHYLYATGSPEDRVGRFDAALAIDAEHAITYLMKARTLLALGKSEEARAVIDEGLKRRPNAPLLVMQRGLGEMEAGHYEEAKTSLRLAIERGAHLQAQVHYAIALLNSGDEERRRPELEATKVIKSTPDRLSFLCNHVLALQRVGRAREADELLGEAMRVGEAAETSVTGELVRCILWPMWFDGVMERFDPSLDKLAATDKVIVQGLNKQDYERAAALRALLAGLREAARGEISLAEVELRRAKGWSDRLEHRLQLARLIASPSLRAEVPPTFEAGWSIMQKAQRAQVRGRMFEVMGDPNAAMAAFEELLAMSHDCHHTTRFRDFPCGAYIADGLSRLAALTLAADDTKRARQAVQAFDELWPKPDGDLPPAVRIATVRAALR